MKSKLQSIVTSFHFSYYSTHEILTVFHLRVPFSLVVYAEDIVVRRKGTPVHYLPRDVALLSPSGCLWSLERLAGGRGVEGVISPPRMSFYLRFQSGEVCFVFIGFIVCLY